MRLRATIAFACAALVLGACGEEGSSQVAATVNGEEISVAEVTEALEEFEQTPQFEQLAQQSGEGSARRQFEQAYLAQQVRRAVLRPAAEALGIEVSQSEIDEQLEQIRSQFPSEKEYEKALEERGFTESELEQLVRDQILEEKAREEVTKDAGATKQEVRDYYESHADAYEQTRVEHILVEKADLAEDISDQLDGAPKAKVDALFAKLARKHSTDPSKSDGGDLGWQTGATFVEPFREAMESLAIGEISDPVRTQFGIHVLRVTGRRQQPFADVADEIEARLSGSAAESAFSRWVREAYERADVEVNPRYGELDPATGQITNATAKDVPGADESSRGSS